MGKQLQNQRGMAMLLEVFVAVVVIAILGFVGWRYFDSQNSTPTASAVTAKHVSASLPDQASTAIIQGAASESAAGVGEDNSSDITSASQSVGEGYDENSF